MMTHLSLFSGIGGLDLAAEWAGFRTVGQCEWADYPTKVLEKHWSDVPRWRDIRTLTKESFFERTGMRTVDVISGGFPCQPFSFAGKRRGKEDDRYLWPEMLRAISEIRPTWVVGENVAGIVNMALDQVLFDLESIGYTIQAFIIPACGVDAQHRRNRVAIVGNSERKYASRDNPGEGGGARMGVEGNGLLQAGRHEEEHFPDSSSFVADAYNAGSGAPKSGVDRNRATQNDGQYKQPQPGFGGRCENVADAEGERCGEAREHSERQEKWTASGGDVSNSAIDGLQGCGIGQIPRIGELPLEPMRSDRGDAGRHYWAPEPNVGRVANGVPSRVDRLKCLGNAVVPQQFYPIFQAIAELEAT